MTENTTAIKYQVGQFVKPEGYTKNAKHGKIIGFVPPFGTAGEWTYNVKWNVAGECVTEDWTDEGCGWRDCDLAPVL